MQIHSTLAGLTLLATLAVAAPVNTKRDGVPGPKIFRPNPLPQVFDPSTLHDVSTKGHEYTNTAKPNDPPKRADLPKPFHPNPLPQVFDPSTLHDVSTKGHEYTNTAKPNDPAKRSDLTQSAAPAAAPAAKPDDHLLQKTGMPFDPSQFAKLAKQFQKQFDPQSATGKGMDFTKGLQGAGQLP